MPTAALVATLPDQTARLYSLTINGADTRTTVDVSSIHVREAGPGGVSSMDFVVQDRLSEWGIPDGTEVQFLDVTNDALIFRGYVDSLEVSPMAAAGRYLTVSCVGVEAWLDWLVLLTDYSAGASINLMGHIAWLMQSLPSPLDVRYNATTTGSSYTYGGIGSLGIGRTNAGVPTTGVVVSAGTTAREAIRSMVAVSDDGVDGYGMDVYVTVDFRRCLRAWCGTLQPPLLLPDQPEDYTTLTITDTVAGTTAAAALSYEREYGDVVHEVFIEGFDAASSGLFADGTGIRGRQVYVADTTITTMANAQIRAQNYMAEQEQEIRGTLTISDYTPPVGTVHAGSLLDLTDAASGATGTYRIFSIDKTFRSGGGQDWTVAFGGHRPSAIRLMRKLTRTTSL